MATDKVSISQGRGTDIAADFINSMYYQRVKISIGPDGQAADLSFGQKAMAESLSVSLATDQPSLPVNQVSAAYDVKATVTRPANQTPYSAGDVVGGAFQFTGAGPTGGAPVMLTGAELPIDIATLPSGMTGWRLHLYSVTPPSALADNAPWTLPSGDRASYLGFIELGTPEAFGATLYVDASNVNKQVKLTSGNLHAYLMTKGGFTPAANSEVYRPTLHTQAV